MAPRRHAILTLSIPLIAYGLLVGLEAYKCRDQINPDAIAYLRNAQYVAEGQFHKSVSGYWSPLLSWCIAPFGYLGFDDLHSARIALAIWGGILVVASYGLIRCLIPRSTFLDSIVLLLIAVVTVRQSTQIITPDLPMFAPLVAYCAVAGSTHLLQDRRLQWGAGVLGGLAYLAKSYALPFFLVHFTFTVALQSVHSSNRSLRRSMSAWGIGLLACALVCGPWISILSFKYGKPTFSTVARVAHSLVGPPDKSRTLPLYDRLYHVDVGRLTTWETPEILPHNYWSPLENWDYLTHQVEYAVETAKQILNDISSYDLFRLSIPVLVFLPVLFWLSGWKSCQLRATWVLGTVAIYVAGFTLVHYEDRYTVGFLWPLCCIYVIGFGSDCFRRMAAKLPLPSWSSLVISTLLIVSFAAQCAWTSWQFERSITRPGAVFRQVGQELQRAGCTGPIAATHEMRYPAMFSAFHMKEQFLGCPTVARVADVEAALQAFGVRMFFVDRDDDWSQLFREQTTWRQQMAIPLETGDLFVYVPSMLTVRATITDSRSAESGASENPSRVESRTITSETMTSENIHSETELRSPSS